MKREGNAGLPRTRCPSSAEGHRASPPHPLPPAPWSPPAPRHHAQGCSPHNSFSIAPGGMKSRNLELSPSRKGFSAPATPAHTAALPAPRRWAGNCSLSHLSAIKLIISGRRKLTEEERRKRSKFYLEPGAAACPCRRPLRSQNGSNTPPHKCAFAGSKPPRSPSPRVLRASLNNPPS